MIIRYDSEANAVYIKIRDSSSSARTAVLDEGTLVDYDSTDKVIGIEILGSGPLIIEQEGNLDGEKDPEELGDIQGSPA